MKGEFFRTLVSAVSQNNHLRIVPMCKGRTSIWGAFSGLLQSYFEVFSPTYHQVKPQNAIEPSWNLGIIKFSKKDVKLSSLYSEIGVGKFGKQKQPFLCNFRKQKSRIPC